MPLWSSATNQEGSLSRSLSSSVVNFGQSAEYAQHAPQAWQSGTLSILAMSEFEMSGLAVE
jgi:hypothetical protein